MRWLMIVSGVHLAACATTPTPKPAAGKLELEPVVVQAKPDPLTNLSIYDARELFHLAREMDRNERDADAIAVYEKLLADFPDSALHDPASFDLGLLYEKGQAYKDAADAYYAIVSEPQPKGTEARRTWIDAHYRLAVCFGKLDAWWRAVEIFDRVLALTRLDDFDRLEAMTGRAIAIQEAGDAPSAEVALSSVLRFYREAKRRNRIEDQGLVAEAAFRLGDIANARYQKVVLEFPTPLLRERLEEKCEYLLSAQNRYLRALRYGDANTVAAAGFRIGELYESLYDTVTGLDAPANLTEEQAAIYEEEVRGRVRILLVKALKVYERAILAGRTTERAGAWVAQLEASIARLKGLLLEAKQTNS